MISLFTLPTYKDMTHVSDYCYQQGKTCSTKDGELEAFLPIWRTVTAGKFPGSLMHLAKRIQRDEYSRYPIVFIISEVRSPKNAYTTVAVAPKQDQNIANCLSYENRYIDRDLGVIILEHTILHDNVSEPSFKFWFYDRDSRPPLPDNILECSFSKTGPGIYLSIEKFADIPANADKQTLSEYEHKYLYAGGVLNGAAVEELVAKHTFSESRSKGCALIDWGDSWNFVVRDEFGSTAFRAGNDVVNAFLEKNGLFQKAG